ncbi:hypothetical protein ACW9UR_15445 [Halovulum sp. GXIMD14794]
MLTSTRRPLAATALLAVLAAPALASDPSLESAPRAGTGFGGYDPVVYQTEGATRIGSAAFAVYHDGLTYYFSSAENAQRFRRDPSRFAETPVGACGSGTGEFLKATGAGLVPAGY